MTGTKTTTGKAAILLAVAVLAIAIAAMGVAQESQGDTSPSQGTFEANVEATSSGTISYFVVYTSTDIQAGDSYLVSITDGESFYTDGEYGGYSLVTSTAGKLYILQTEELEDGIYSVAIIKGTTIVEQPDISATLLVGDVGVSINNGEESVSVTVGGSEGVSATISPEGYVPTLTWSSDDESIARVTDNGGAIAIQGVAVGTAVITVSFDYNGVTYSDKISVNVNPVKVTSVSISESSGKTDVSIGESVTLEIDAIPTEASGYTVEWAQTSEDGGAVIISGDDSTVTVTGQTAGNVSITATVTNYDGSSVTSSAYNLEVKTVPVSGITIKNEAGGVLGIGGEMKLDVEIQPSNATNKVLAWESSDPDVATVAEDGTIRGVSEGTTTITVRSTDGSDVSATYQLTVETVHVTGVTLDTDSVELAVNGTCTLVADVQPANAGNKAMSWSSSDPNVATVSDSGVVTAVSAGEAVITVTTEDGTFTDTCTVTVIAGYNVIFVSDHGSVDTSSLAVEHGGSVEFTVSPDNGYEIVSVTANGSTISPVDGVYTVEDIDADMEIVIEYRYVGVEPDNPGIIIPPYYDDDYVPLPPVYEVDTGSDAGDDDTTTIVACAAAAVVAALMAVFLLLEYRKR